MCRNMKTSDLFLRVQRSIEAGAEISPRLRVEVEKWLAENERPIPAAPPMPKRLNAETA